MKKKLLTVTLLMGSLLANAQIGIGTLNPNDASMMEVSSTNKGILIPRIALLNTSDTTTITSGNVNSLLVFNTTSNAELQPGYYYWYDNFWKRLAISDEIHKETITILEALGQGVYNYNSELGVSTLINVPSDVIENFTSITSNSNVLNHLVSIIRSNAGNVYYNNGVFTYLNENGEYVNIDFDDLVQTNQTLTSLVYDSATNELKYNDENNVLHTILLNNTKNSQLTIVDNVLTLTDTDGSILTTDLSVYLDNTDNQQITDFGMVDNILTITLENGGTKTVDLSHLLNGTHITPGENVIISGIGSFDNPYMIHSENTKNESLTLLQERLIIADTDGDTIEVDLSHFLDNTDEQQITDFSLSEDYQLTIQIENGNTQVVNLSPLKTHVTEGENVTITGSGTSTDPYVIIPHKTIVTGGVNVTVAPQTDGVTTNYTISVPTANESSLGVVKQAEEAPTVLISSEGELSINFDALSDFKEITEDYTASLKDFTLFGNAQGNTINITLPSPIGIKGKKLTIKKSDENEEAYVNVTSLVGNIEGITELYTSLPYSGWDIMSDGRNWRIVNKF